MTWEPTSHAKNIAVLVVNKDHPRFGQMGQQTFHDWREYGVRYVKFKDGEDSFNDGLCKGDPVSPVKTYYLLKNEKGQDFDEQGLGPKSLKADFIQFGFGSEEEFLSQYERLFGFPF